MSAKRNIMICNVQDRNAKIMAHTQKKVSGRVKNLSFGIILSFGL